MTDPPLGAFRTELWRAGRARQRAGKALVALRGAALGVLPQLHGVKLAAIVKPASRLVLQQHPDALLSCLLEFDL